MCNVSTSKRLVLIAYYVQIEATSKSGLQAEFGARHKRLGQGEILGLVLGGDEDATARKPYPERDTKGPRPRARFGEMDDSSCAGMIS